MMRGVEGRDLREQVLIGVSLTAGVIGFFYAVSTGQAWGRVFSFSVSTFFVFIGGLQQYLVRRRLQRAAILVRRWPMRLGEDVEVKFRATLRRNSPVTSVSAMLECIEHAVHGTGKYAVPRRETLYSINLRSAVIPAGERKVREAWNFTLPDALPPSFAVSHNSIQWLLHISVRTEHVDVPATFELLVMPEVVVD